MEDKQFYKNIAEICETVLENAKHISFDIGLLNETMIELDKRAKVEGLVYKDLYPKHVKR